MGGLYRKAFGRPMNVAMMLKAFIVTETNQI